MTEGAGNAGLEICIISLPVLLRQEGTARMRAEATEVCATIGLVRQRVNIHTAWEWGPSVPEAHPFLPSVEPTASRAASTAQCREVEDAREIVCL